MAEALRFGLWYDFRNPPQWRRPYERLYEEIFEQITWADANGFDDVWLSEHHFTDDGYSPSLLPIAAAIASRTRRLRIATGVLILPLHDPVRLAEDAATVDIISGGRFELGVGVGYRPEEFEGSGVPVGERGRRADEALEIIRRLWSGDVVTFDGSFYRLRNARLSPQPLQHPVPIWVGGHSDATFRRAARYGQGYVGLGSLRGAFKRYVAALDELGKPTSDLRMAGGLNWLLPADDPDKAWAEAADHVIYQLNTYADWTQQAGINLMPRIRDRDHLRETGLFAVVDVDTCVQRIRDYVAANPVSHFYCWTVPPGLDPSWVQPHLELFAREVIPAVRRTEVPAETGSGR